MASGPARIATLAATDAGRGGVCRAAAAVLINLRDPEISPQARAMAHFEPPADRRRKQRLSRPARLHRAAGHRSAHRRQAAGRRARRTRLRRSVRPAAPARTKSARATRIRTTISLSLGDLDAALRHLQRALPAVRARSRPGGPGAVHRQPPADRSLRAGAAIAGIRRRSDRGQAARRHRAQQSRPRARRAADGGGAGRAAAACSRGLQLPAGRRRVLAARAVRSRHAGRQAVRIPRACARMRAWPAS